MLNEIVFIQKDEEEDLELEVQYVSVIDALLYLAQCTRPDISFAINLFVRCNHVPTHIPDRC